jgi:hypothetical protein
MRPFPLNNLFRLEISSTFHVGPSRAIQRSHLTNKSMDVDHLIMDVDRVLYDDI